jgi:hypothetical protein
MQANILYSPQISMIVTNGNIGVSGIYVLSRIEQGQLIQGV